MISDPHFGKAAHFRKSGIPVPEDIHNDDLSNILYLIQYYNPERMIFLGDIFHSSYNSSWEVFRSFFVEKIEIQPELVIGNHDIMEEERYDFMRMHGSRLDMGPFTLSHEPVSIPGESKYNICGHVHPAIRVKGPIRHSLRVPCFYFGEHQGIMPAFGGFTGTHLLKKRSDKEMFFAVADQLVIAIN